jgi:hypothetical protein
MARDLNIDAGYEAVPSPQWVKDGSKVGNAAAFQAQWISGILAAIAMSAAASSFSSI